jgi:hypothetical protein
LAAAIAVLREPEPWSAVEVTVIIAISVEEKNLASSQ